MIVAEVVCPGVPATDEFPMERSIRQGGVESLWFFALVICTIVVEHCQRWSSTGVGVAGRAVIGYYGSDCGCRSTHSR